jgi:MFS family permease
MKTKTKLPRGVVFLGVVSLLNDMAGEIITPLLPLFISQQLGAGPAFLGTLEGAADSLSSLLKRQAGRWSDKPGLRERLVWIGYVVASVTRPFLGVATSAIQVLGIRLADRTGKGLRSAPRDSWLGQMAAKGDRGRVFGFHQAMDHVGSIVGPLLAALYLALRPGQMRELFLAASVPGLAAAALAWWTARHYRTARPGTGPASKEKADPPAGREKLSSESRRFLWAVGLFTLANSSDTFLLLRLRQLGWGDEWIPPAWAALHVVRAVSTQGFGTLSDRIGSKPLILSGWLVYAGVYLALGWVHSLPLAGILFLAYGTVNGLTDGPEKSWVTRLGPKQGYGRLFGAYHLVLGIGAFPASVAFGTVWERWGAHTAFTSASVVALAAACVLITVHEPRDA